MKREEARELAELDVSNIITTQGTSLIYWLATDDISISDLYRYGYDH